MRVHYLVLPHPESHLYSVTLTIAEPDPAGQQFALPAWIPGSYMIRDFAKNIVEIRARDETGPVTLTKLDKQSWRAAPARGALTVEYSVYAWDLSVRGAHLDTTHAYFNGTSLFLRVAAHDAEPCTVELRPPEGDGYRDWNVATTLPRRGAAENGFGGYEAADYDELIDHPVEMGTFTRLGFDACGVPHEVAITGRHRCDTARLALDLKKICEHQIRLFGEPAPMPRYLFQVMAVGDGYGGLEHRSSTSLICSRNDLPRPDRKEMSEEYRTFLGLCSHEYFHTWNVKRIKPAAFVPYDLTREVHTSLLWAFEGFTAYYDDLTLARTGLIDHKGYLELLGQTITRLLRSAGRKRQSAAESSFDAWTKFYKADENAPNAIVSYYVKGAVIALALDFTLRAATADAHSLDDLMRALWADYGATGTGVTDGTIEAIASALAGRDLKPFFDQAVRGTEEIDLAPLFGAVGIDYRLRTADSPSDKGGKPGKEESPRRVSLGIRTGDDPLGAKLINVFDGGAARQAGLAPGDILVALDGLRVTHGNLEKALTAFAPGDRVEVHAFRRDELMPFRVTLQAPVVDTCYLVLRDDAPPEAVERRRKWLGGSSP
jgi:predicted metalloprotease with PDZ domain